MAGNERIIISLGGSLLVPDEIDTEFIGAFRALVEREVQKGNSFIIITGGGKICRKYQAAAQALGVSSSENLDWVGIHVTRMNAEFFHTVLGDMAHDEIITNPTAVGKIEKPVAVGAGWKPGCSTDLDAVLIAKHFSAKKLINLSNIDYLYDSDPKQNPKAKKIERATWKELRAIVGDEYRPGMNAPFDPVAAREAEKLGLEVAIMNGKKLENLENYLAGRGFVGTVISN